MAAGLMIPLVPPVIDALVLTAPLTAGDTMAVTAPLVAELLNTDVA